MFEFPAPKKVNEYVPRHIRLATVVKVPDVKFTISQPDEVPVVDENGNALHTIAGTKEVPCNDVIGKNRTEMFDIAVKVKNGVPLDLVSLNLGRLYENSQVMQIAQKINNVSEYAALLEKQKNETKAYFDQFVEPNVEPQVQPNNEGK